MSSPTARPADLRDLPAEPERAAYAYVSGEADPKPHPEG
jgi:hypothetical protein